MIAVLQEDARLLEATGEHIPLIESIEAVVSAFRVSLKKSELPDEIFFVLSVLVQDIIKLNQKALIHCHLIF